MAGACSGGTILDSCIVWENEPKQLGTVASVSYSNIQGGWPGPGNIDADPFFWGVEHGDYRLLPASPCIDTGNPADQDPDGSRLDMGAFPFDPDYCGTPGSYCSAKSNSAGCLPAMRWSGTPTLTGPDDFHVRATDVLPSKVGILIWSTEGAAEIPFFGGLRCIAAPLKRSRPLRSTPDGNGDCIGVFDYPFTQGFMTSQGLQAGSRLYLQIWHRDPAQPDGTGVGLTDGLEATICAGP
jgi:hypothetical protein